MLAPPPQTLQPYVGIGSSPEDDTTLTTINRKEEARNLLLVVAGWTLLLLLIPPQHEYPIIDDWIYAGSVREQMATGAFTMPLMSQANLVGLTLWGTLWARLFGFSFTILTYSTLLMSLAALLAFYGIARAVRVPPWGALLGTGLLLFNPLFVHLSYSFMTDVPFLALMLVASFCYIRGLQTHHLAWFVAAGLSAGWSFLIRQYGLLVPLGFLLYLGLKGLLERRWHWREGVLTALVPGLIIGGWYVWSRQLPQSAAAFMAAERASHFVFKEPWLRVFSLRALTVLPITALFAWAAVKIKPSRWWLVAVWTLVVIWGLLNLDLPDEQLVETPYPPFTLQIGPISVGLSSEMYTFGDWGNIVRTDGIDFFEYQQQPIWSPETWRALWAPGLGLGIVLLARLTSSLRDWLKARIEHVPLSPLVGFYLVGISTVVVSLAFPASLFDRYVLAFLPFVILFVVRGSPNWGRVAWTYSIVTFVLIAAFTLLAKADAVEHDNARWQAAQWLAARVGRLHGGYDWDNWMGGRNDAYPIADVQLPGYRVERRFPYTSRLSGFDTRYVLAQARADVPPISSR